MKSHEAIGDALSTWRPVQSAADLAHEVFRFLSPVEVERLALRGLTEEIRSALRRKDSDGVPAYANVDKVDPSTGKSMKIYKQTSMFDEADYRVAVDSYRQRSLQNAAVAEALRAQCLSRLGVDPLPFEVAS